MIVDGAPPVVGLLGPVSADSGAGLASPAGMRARRLLAALALRTGEFCSAASLIERVWEGAPPQSSAALHTQMSRLRPLLSDGVIESIAGGYRLALPPAAIDVWMARDLIERGDSESLTAATALWRGTPGADLGDGLIADEVTRAADITGRMLDDARARDALATGHLDLARELAEKLLTSDPLDEVAAELLMRAHWASNRRADALAVFARMRRTLSDELGADPGASIVLVHNEILADSGGDTESLKRPAPRSAIGLRAEPNELIGRAETLDALTGYLDTSRVVTIQGPGGAGKTRVANAIGRRLANEGRCVVAVALASVRDDDDVLSAIAATLGVTETEIAPSGRATMRSRSLLSLVAESVSVRPTVIVLDNCEQVIEGCARLVSDLLALTETLRVLATSRSPLRVDGEQIYLLPPLLADNADASGPMLFISRAHAVRPDAELPPDEVASLCSQLEGLPLAIELAAARVRTMTVTEIIDRLSQRFTLLRSGNRSSPDRHRTLAAVIEWSWDLLGPSAAQVLTATCRLPAGFDRATAAELTGLDLPDVDDALDELVGQSLLTAGTVTATTASTTRYRMLEMVREFGDLKIAQSHREDSVDIALAHWAISLCRRARELNNSGSQREAVELMGVEVDNITWILRCALAADRALPTERSVVTALFPTIAMYWAAKGLHSEIFVLSTSVIDSLERTHGQASDREMTIAAYLIAGHVQLIPRKNLRLVARARARLREFYRRDLAVANEPDFAAAVLLDWPHHMSRGLRVIMRGAHSGDDSVRALALIMAANLAENHGLVKSGHRYAQRALVEAEARNDHRTASFAHLAIAGSHTAAGEFESAVECYERALEQMNAVSATVDAAEVQYYRANALIGLGRIADARAACEATAAATATLEVGMADDLAVLRLLTLAELALAEGDGAKAINAFRESGDCILAHHNLSSGDPGVAFALSAALAGLVLADGHADTGDYVDALVSAIRIMFETNGFWDQVAASAAAIAVGAIWCATGKSANCGAELLVLGLRMRPRPYYYSISQLVANAQTYSGLDAPSWSALRDSVTVLPMRDVVGRLVATLTAPSP